MGELNATTSKRSSAKKWEHWSEEKMDKMIKELIESKKGIEIYHIISRGNRWGILRERGKRMSKKYDDKQAAVEHARRLAQKSPKWKVIIHKKDASLESSIHSDNSN